MRNLMIVTMAGAGAWMAVQSSQAWAGTLFHVGTMGSEPMGALFFLPALLLGGVAGALLGGLLAPMR